MSTQSEWRTIRRLNAAEGYLELGMASHALEELHAINASGPYDAAKNYLLGEALKAQERYAEAVEPLQNAARLAPLPQSQQVWMSLSECLRKSGQDTLAEAAELNASVIEQAGQAIAKAIGRLPASMPVANVVVNIVVQTPPQDDSRFA